MRKALADINYPFHDKIAVVTNCGRICLGHKNINFSTVFAGRAVGIKQVHDGIGWLAYGLRLWDTLISKSGCSNRSITHSAPGCHLCSRYIV